MLDRTAAGSRGRAMLDREPVVLSLELCDAVRVDPATNAWSLVGLRHRLASASFPLVVPRLGVYVAFTECRGRVPLGLRVADVDDERPPLVDVTIEFTAASPVDVSQMDATLAGLTFPAAGAYVVQLLWRGKLLAERRLFVAAAGDGG